ncbi:MAG: Ig-like domain-containing protein, partial [Pirellulaceae bacterium]
MSSRQSRTLSTFAHAIQRLVRRNPDRLAVRKRQARLRFLEHLEPRNLMAVNIVGLSPADGDINWPLNTDLTINFNVPVVKGQGAINVVRQDTG